MIVLGIDPGTKFLGFGLIENSKKKVTHVDNGLIMASQKMAMPEKLKKIFDELTVLIEKFSPGAIALEDVFVAKNVRSSLKLGYAKGVVMLAAAQRGIPVYEYSPAEVKKAVSSFGQASKEQMQKMVRLHLKLKEVACEDATDALAVALCHCQTRHFS